MISLNATHLVAFTAKIEEIQSSYRAITDASFSEDYATCFDSQENALNEAEFSALRKIAKKSEDELHESNYLKIKNLKIAIEECERQIAIECALSYLESLQDDK